jgi:hypothetical protein
LLKRRVSFFEALQSFLVGAMLTLALKPQWVHYKLDETIEQSCSDFLTHTLEYNLCRV